MKNSSKIARIATGAVLSAGLIFSIGGCAGAGENSADNSVNSSAVVLSADGDYKITAGELYNDMKEVVGEDVLVQKALCHILEKDLGEEQAKQLKDEADKSVDGQIAQQPNAKVDEAQVNIAKQNNYMQNLLRASLEKSVDTSDEALKYEYETNFQPKMSAKHILITDEQGGESKAKEVISKIKEDGSNWDELAKEYSQDPGNKDKGGDLGYFSPSDMVNGFSEAVAKMEKGTWSKEPVKTQFGYHIIYCVDPGKEKQPFEEVKEQLKNDTIQNKINSQQYVQEFVYNTLKNANVKISDKALENAVEKLKPETKAPAPSPETAPQEAPAQASEEASK